MTKREMFTAIVNGDVNAEVVAMAQAELEKLDKANATKSSKAAEEKAKVNVPLMNAIAEFLTEANTIVLASDVAKVVGVSTQKAQALLKKMVDAGQVNVFDVKVEKVGARKGYAIA